MKGSFVGKVKGGDVALVLRQENMPMGKMAQIFRTRCNSMMAKWRKAASEAYEKAGVCVRIKEVFVKNFVDSQYQQWKPIQDRFVLAFIDKCVD